MESSGRLLVVEDHESERRLLSQLLKAEGFQVFGAENADKAIGYIDENIDIVLSDLKMGEVSGMDLLTLWKQRKPETQFILITGNASVGSAVEAIKNGAYDYVTKPVNPSELIILIRRAIESHRKDKELDSLRQRLDQKFGLEQIIGQSPQMKMVFAKIQRAAPVDSTVLILGESGTGKELVAQALHHNSPRKHKPFVAVNCAAVPASLVESELFGHVRGAFTGATDRRIGRFEQANGGTLFVDEIGDFELGLQSKLLRVVETLTFTPVGGHEEHTVDVRVVAATSRDINKMVAEGTFRQDLFYRLNVVSISLPTLRERTDDLPILVDYLLKDIARSKHTSPKRIDAPVMRRFHSYHWPGNVRQLRNTLESMMVLADVDLLTEKDLPEWMAQGNGAPPTGNIPTGLTMDAMEKMAILNALEKAGGNRTHAAEQLNISVRTLQRKLQLYSLESQGASPPPTSGEPSADVISQR
jgi:DNA-binding NtrC family response regulator